MMARKTLFGRLNGLATSWTIRGWHEMLPEPDWKSSAATGAIKYVLSFTTACSSLDEAYVEAPREIALHVARSQEFQAEDRLMMAGGFADADGPLTTMVQAVGFERVV
jgi:hypothetical protein